MVILSKYRTTFTIIVAVLLIIVATSAIFWARGFRPNLKNHSIDRTGLLVVSSIPTGAHVYLDNRLTSATDTTIAYLDPHSYKVKIEKDGYIAWEKDIEVRADLATEIKALLFPTAPEIKPLTTTGASNPVLSPDGGRIAYAAPGERGGLYILPMSDRPFPFRQDARLIAKNQASYDFTKAQFLWGPDSKQLIARFTGEDGQAIANLLLDSDKNDQEMRDISASMTNTISGWQQEINTRAQTQAQVAPESVTSATAEAKIASPAPLTFAPSPSPSPSPTTQLPNYPTTQLINYFPTGLNFSPDEEKVLYQNKEGKYKIYDIKNKKEYTLPDFKDFLNISWYPDSNHLVVAEKGIVSVVEADGNNKMTIFSGKFEDGFVFAHPSGQRIIILTTLTQTEGTPPNLYAINLR